MQTIGLRRLLPVFALLGIALLLLIQALDERISARRTAGLLEAPASATSDPIILQREFPMPLGVVSILAAPGILPFALLGAGPASESLRSPLYLSIIAVATALAWYLAGRWIDRRRRGLRSPWLGRFQFLNWILLVMWVAAIAIVTAVLLDIDFMGEMQWMAAGVALWGAFIVLVFIFRIRDQRRAGRIAATATAQAHSVTS
jgi:hypothetical protein